MPMKKLYLVIALVLAGFQAFSRSRVRLSDDAWTILIILGIILFIALGYLFLHASLEQYVRDRKIKDLHTEDETLEEHTVEFSDSPKFKKRSDDLMNLFMLKRKGVINDREYQQLKDRLIRKKL